jgi:inhibitor of cysteine peptidase
LIGDYLMLKEIKKRAQIYGVVAVILAVMLGALCYNFGIYPAEFKPPAQSSSGFLSTFSSYEELKNFLTTNSRTQGPFLFLGPLDINSGPVRSMVESSQSAYFTAPGLSPEPTYSTTNIQVAGVDEADIVKTDGEYIYLASGSNVFILKAYPAEEAKILSQVTFNDTSFGGIFVSRDSNRLVVLGCKYKFPEFGYRTSFIIDVKTFADVYDISNKSKPALLANFTMTGSYFNSRMIGDYVYFVVSQPSYVIYDTVILPKIYLNGERKEIGATEVLYSDTSDNYFLYTTVVALNMQNATEQPTRKTIMLGGTSSMYVSLNNIYMTFPELYGNTTIYRIRVENSTISPEAKGEVPGHELNQFSMDEYNNYFRIATTRWVNGTTQNNLYVLNMNLSIVGSLENIAPSETIDSARFIGNRCYLATSIVRRDPFFVIDVENATEPKILGYLKIPGFTRYLHPCDESHVIGVGRDENNSVKISLFDVSNVSDPVEIDMYSVGGVWSDTLVLTEHKAFLFDKSKDLLAIPVSIYYNGDKYWQWQGLYVFNITISEGLVLRGNITHEEYGGVFWDSNYWVNRALYIENVLYTVSDKKIKMNSLEDLTEIKEIQLS